MYVCIPCHAHISSIHGSFCGRMLTEGSHAFCLLYVFSSFMMVSLKRLGQNSHETE